MVKTQFPKNIFIIICATLVTLFTGCGDSSNTGNDVAPTELSSFAGIKFIGSSNGNQYFNFQGTTVGVVTAAPVTTAIKGTTVEVTLTGAFSYSKTGNTSGRIILSFTQALTTGGLDTAMTIEELADNTTLDWVESAVIDLEFFNTGGITSNGGSAKYDRTFESGSSSTTNETFELSTVAITESNFNN